MQRYAEFGRISFDEDKHLFRGITKTRNYEILRTETPLSYSRIRELVKEAFENIIDTFLIGVHSLRSGGATAVTNAGVHDRMFKRQRP